LRLLARPWHLRLCAPQAESHDVADVNPKSSKTRGLSGFRKLS
jgi:hypothetical protein